MDCGFYKLQKVLREKGWYIEWTEASQGNHAWEDMPLDHEEGPFEGVKIDESKCLLTFVDHEDSFYDCLVERLPRPEGLSDDDLDEMIGNFMDSLNEQDLEAVAKWFGGMEKWEEFLVNMPDSTPEGLGGNYFMLSLRLDDEDAALVNLKAVLPLFESCGCRYSNLSKDGLTIEWGDQ
jgi:hypothetical protein